MLDALVAHAKVDGRTVASCGLHHFSHDSGDVYFFLVSLLILLRVNGGPVLCTLGLT